MVKKLSANDTEEITSIFAGVFCAEPWNDDWSNKEQLDLFIQDLTGNPNSLTLGFYLNDVLTGISMGHIRHWYSGTEYYIDELCIKAGAQGKGRGSRFLQEIENYLLENGIPQIFLMTERNVPAYSFYIKNGFDELDGYVAFTKTCTAQTPCSKNTV